MKVCIEVKLEEPVLGWHHQQRTAGVSIEAQHLAGAAWCYFKVLGLSSLLLFPGLFVLSEGMGWDAKLLWVARFYLMIWQQQPGFVRKQ